MACISATTSTYLAQNEYYTFPLLRNTGVFLSKLVKCFASAAHYS